jgi:hypothetical protein
VRPHACLVASNTICSQCTPRTRSKKVLEVQDAGACMQHLQHRQRVSAPCQQQLNLLVDALQQLPYPSHASVTGASFFHSFWGNHCSQGGMFQRSSASRAPRGCHPSATLLQACCSNPLCVADAPSSCWCDQTRCPGSTPEVGSRCPSNLQAGRSCLTLAVAVCECPQA